VSKDQRAVKDVMRRFLVYETLSCFTIEESAISSLMRSSKSLEQAALGKTFLREKFDGFTILLGMFSEGAAWIYLEAGPANADGGIRVEDAEEEMSDAKITLAKSKSRWGPRKRETALVSCAHSIRPFFPEIFVCSEVMGEGGTCSDSAARVIHHDSPGIRAQRQRTGRIDRLGLQSEGRQHIVVTSYWPARDERQYK